MHDASFVTNRNVHRFAVQRQRVTPRKKCAVGGQTALYNVCRHSFRYCVTITCCPFTSFMYPTVTMLSPAASPLRISTRAP
jgi:hypothetical protein